MLGTGGSTINTMILAGLVIALGDVVDDAIIDVENIVRRLRQHRRDADRPLRPRAVILEASMEVRGGDRLRHPDRGRAVVTPVFFLAGLSGAFFRPLAIAYALAILASMLVALTVTPALCLILLREGAAERRAVAAGRAG